MTSILQAFERARQQAASAPVSSSVPPREATVIVTDRETRDQPSGPLARNVGLTGLPLGVERVEVHVEAFLARLAGIHRTCDFPGTGRTGSNLLARTELAKGSARRFGDLSGGHLLSEFFRPKKTQPFHLVPRDLAGNRGGRDLQGGRDIPKSSWRTVTQCSTPSPFADQLCPGDGPQKPVEPCGPPASWSAVLLGHGFEALGGFAGQAAVGHSLNAIAEPPLKEAAVIGGGLEIK